VVEGQLDALDHRAGDLGHLRRRGLAEDLAEAGELGEGLLDAPGLPLLGVGLAFGGVQLGRGGVAVALHAGDRPADPAEVRLGPGQRQVARRQVDVGL
jgi:hypothetical protein